MEVNRIILYDQLIQKKADKEGEKQNKKKEQMQQIEDSWHDVTF